MRGTVFHQEEAAKMFSVQLENGDYSVVEITGNGVVAFGDIITGGMGKPGFIVLANQTTLTQLEVIVHYAECTKVEALQRTMMN